MKALLIVAKILGFIVVFFFLVLVISQFVASIQHPEQAKEISYLNYAFYILVLLASFAYFLAWRHEGLGGLIMTLCAIAISSLSEWELGLPFFIVGQLFVLYWYLLKIKPSPSTTTIIRE